MKKIFFITLAVLLLTACAESELQTADGDTDGFSVELSVRADVLLENMHLLHSDSHELVPADGIIFHDTATAYYGESVFCVLNREMRDAGIHLVFRQTPVFDSVYIEAINNIFEFDAGPLSGWKYRVNGEVPGFGASLYIIEPGDVIEWLYTLDLGRDIGSDVGSDVGAGE